MNGLGKGGLSSLFLSCEPQGFDDPLCHFQPVLAGACVKRILGIPDLVNRSCRVERAKKGKQPRGAGWLRVKGWQSLGLLAANDLAEHQPQEEAPAVDGRGSGTPPGCLAGDAKSHPGPGDAQVSLGIFYEVFFMKD